MVSDVEFYCGKSVRQLRVIAILMNDDCVIQTYFESGGVLRTNEWLSLGVRIFGENKKEGERENDRKEGKESIDCCT
jgi:hypothetical protein